MNGRIGRVKRAFSLIELMIVIVIMAVLAAVIIPRFSDHSRRGIEAGLRHDLSQVRTGIATFRQIRILPQDARGSVGNTAPAQGYDSSGTLQNIHASDWHGAYVGNGARRSDERHAFRLLDHHSECGRSYKQQQRKRPDRRRVQHVLTI